MKKRSPQPLGTKCGISSSRAWRWCGTGGNNFTRATPEAGRVGVPFDCGPDPVASGSLEVAFTGGCLVDMDAHSSKQGHKSDQ